MNNESTHDASKPNEIPTKSMQHLNSFLCTDFGRKIIYHQKKIHILQNKPQILSVFKEM